MGDIAGVIAQYAMNPVVECLDCHKVYTITNPDRWRIFPDSNELFDEKQNVHIQEIRNGDSNRYQLICGTCSLLRECIDCSTIAFPSVIDEFTFCVRCHVICDQCTRKYQWWMDLLGLHPQIGKYCKKCSFENQWTFQGVPI